MRFLDGWVVMKGDEYSPTEVYYSKEEAELVAKRKAKFWNSKVINHDDFETGRVHN